MANENLEESNDAELVRDIQARLQAALLTNRDRWTTEDGTFQKLVQDADSSPPHEREARRLQERLAEASYERAGVVMGVYNSFATTDVRFRWQMPKVDWDYVSEHSNIHDSEARRTLEAYMRFSQSFVRIASERLPPRIETLMQTVNDFLATMQSLLTDESVRHFLSTSKSKAESSTKRATTNDLLEMEAVTNALQAMSREFFHAKPMTRQAITQQMLEDLSMFVSFYAHRPISFGSASNNDFNWIERVIDLVGHDSDGLTRAIKTFISQRNGDSVAL